MTKRLLLIGGGHSHLFVLEALRERKAEWRDKLQVTLLSEELHTQYSGMLPGLVAGHYRPSECQIDLAPLAQLAGVELVQARVDRLDLVLNTARAGEREWPFDLVSIDIGSTPPVSEVPGASAHALPVKPFDSFVREWRQFQAQIESLAQQVHLIVVGGGAGGVEVALAMAHRLQPFRDRMRFSLVTDGELLAGYPRRAARLAARQLQQAGIALREHAGVSQVDEGKLHFSDGSTAGFDALVWATGAQAQSWISASGLASVDSGFVSVNQFLQSRSHPQAFAAGDVATNPDQRRPKAGVFAVRQGPVLAENILRCAAGEPLCAYHPQKDYLSLLSTGRRHAIASWYGLVWEGAWVWRWKNRIDQRFIRRFSVPFAKTVDEGSEILPLP